MTQRTWKIVGGCLGISGILAACATTDSRMPNEELAKARTVLEQADKGGNAQRFAAADLQRAHDEVNDAQRALEQRRYPDARRLAQQAEVDADLASARGNAAAAQQSADELRSGIDTLRQEAQRSNQGQ